MNDLTEAMGIGSPSLYAAFGSKEALFREAVALYRTTIEPGIWIALDDEGTVDDAIRDFLMRTADAFSDAGRPAGCLIILGARHAEVGGSAVGDELRRCRVENITRLRARFERAVRAGDLPDGFDCSSAAVFYAALQAGMSILARDGADAGSLRAIASGGLQSLMEMKRQSVRPQQSVKTTRKPRRKR